MIAHAAMTTSCNSHWLQQRLLSCASPRFSLPKINASLKRRVQLSSRFPCRALYVDDEDYLLDAPVSAGDGFSFAGGKYSIEEGPSEKWFARGKWINAYAMKDGSKKARDPVFGLALGEASQVSDESLRWFCVEEGDSQNASVLLVHGFPSQSYSYRNVLPILSSEFHVIAFDWVGFGFSDKPQVNYGFNYTMEEYINAFTCLVESLALERMSIVCQGFATPVVLEFARRNEKKVDRLVLLNPPVTEQHAKLPSALSIFTNFLLGEIFVQDPLKAGENPINECGPYVLNEEDAMVYRRPYLTSGSAGFALQAISRELKKELKVGHHGQEDFPEEVGAAIRASLKRPLLV
ncbi:hypothetical protein KP509_10G064900 [Ceratopteris richardii]|uniref:AB hydrolase-1 domain-containing protein n=1 Tax=Ceratopteris richardii TaxID=49495 RepID=A0A8T2TY80_CERRI|nr:hypothetical protein KP509_10G064900 [Ceratopteris richardii]